MAAEGPNIYRRLRAQPMLEWSNEELAGVVLAISMRGKASGMDPWLVEALQEGSRRIAGDEIRHGH